jgi:O-antigen chain-terminating methyltransferase
MEQIKEKIENKNYVDSYKTGGHDRILEMRKSSDAPGSQCLDEIRNYLALLQNQCQPGIEPPISSHRRLIGPIIVFAKKVLRKILRYVTNKIMSRQIEFNRLLIKFLQILEQELNTNSATLNSVVAQGEHLSSIFQKIEGNFNDLFKKVDDWHDKLVNNFNYLRTEHERLAQRHVELFQKAMEVRQENILQKHRLDRILTKLSAKYDFPKEEAATLVRESGNLMDHNYFLFENKYRGPQEEIKKRQEVYLPIFRGSDNVLDIGCGRGEFLELLKNNGVKASGIDLNEDMIYLCKEKKLDAEQIDAITYLSRIDSDFLGGIIACHVIEHLKVDLLIEFVKLCWEKLKKGAPVIFETPNPQSIIVSAINFHLDLSHLKPIHPESIKFLLESIGFVDIQIKLLSPYPEEMKLQPIKNINNVSSEKSNTPEEVLNKNIETLNSLLFGYQDYAIIARK